MAGDLDDELRAATFAFLADQVRRHGDSVPWTVLTSGFVFQGRTIALMNPQRGIWKPAALDLPISITTTPVVEGRERPYEDSWDGDGRLLYRYQGRDPNSRDNVGLRQLMARGTPLVYFYGTRKGRYMPVWPAYIVDADPATLTFTVALAMPATAASPGVVMVEEDIPRRYAMRLTRQRMHQAAFRERVLVAYGGRCTVCDLQRTELLDAAHILDDANPASRSRVSNGLALCRLHHGAFDTFLMGIRSDLTVEIRQDVLDEIDGPTLKHALQGVHGRRIRVPRRQDQRPDTEFLDERYEQFRSTG